VAKAGPLPRRGSSVDNVGPPSGRVRCFWARGGPGGVGGLRAVSPTSAEAARRRKNPLASTLDHAHVRPSAGRAPGRSGEAGGGVQDGVTEGVDLAVGDDGLVGEADELGPADQSAAARAHSIQALFSATPSQGKLLSPAAFDWRMRSSTRGVAAMS